MKNSSVTSDWQVNGLWVGGCTGSVYQKSCFKSKTLYFSSVAQLPEFQRSFFSWVECSETGRNDSRDKKYQNRDIKMDPNLLHWKTAQQPAHVQLDMFNQRYPNKHLFQNLKSQTYQMMMFKQPAHSGSATFPAHLRWIYYLEFLSFSVEIKMYLILPITLHRGALRWDLNHLPTAVCRRGCTDCSSNPAGHRCWGNIRWSRLQKLEPKRSHGCTRQHTCPTTVQCFDLSGLTWRLHTSAACIYKLCLKT